MNHWIILTILLSVISPVFYTRSILAHKAQPHRVTRFIVLIASISGILGILHSTNKAGIIFALIFLTRALYLFVLSIMYGVGGASRSDKACLVIGLISVLTYSFTGNGWAAVLLGILADFIGYIPTFIKTWKKPESEDPLFFSIEGMASLAGVFAIGEFRVDILFPIYFVASSLMVIALIYRKKIAKIFKKSSLPTDIPL